MSKKWLNYELELLDVLTPFTYNYFKKRSSSEIANFLNSSKRTISRRLNEAVEKKIINSFFEGKNKFYYLDKNNPNTINTLITLETYKTFKFKLKFPEIFFKINNFEEEKIIFGSYAKNNFQNNSDIDILFFTLDENKFELLENFHVLTESFSNFKRKLFKKETLALEILDNHILFNNHEKWVNIFISVSNGED